MKTPIVEFITPDKAKGERELFDMERLLVADHIQMKYHGKPSFLKPLYTK